MSDPSPSSAHQGLAAFKEQAASVMAEAKRQQVLIMHVEHFAECMKRGGAMVQIDLQSAQNLIVTIDLGTSNAPLALMPPKPEVADDPNGDVEGALGGSADPADPADPAVVCDFQETGEARAVADAVKGNVASAPPVKAKPRGAAVTRKKIKLTPQHEPDYRTGKYTEKEITHIHALLDEGATNSVIAKALGRKPSAVSVKLAHVRKKREADRIALDRDAPAAVPRPDPAPAAEVMPSTSVQKTAIAGPATAQSQTKGLAVPFDDSIPSAERLLIAHLDALGYAGGWTPDLDHALVTGLAGGSSLAQVADALGFENIAAIKKRWFAMNQKPGDLDHQGLLMRILKRRSEE